MTTEVKFLYLTQVQVNCSRDSVVGTVTGLRTGRLTDRDSITGRCITYLLTYLLTHLLTYLLTHLLTPRSRDLLEKLTGFQPVKKFPAFYRIRRFITAFTSARYLSLSRASSIQSIPPHPILKIHLNIILPPTPGSPKWSLSLRFPQQNPVYSSLFPHTRYMPRPFHASRFYHPNDIGWAVQIIKLLIM